MHGRWECRVYVQEATFNYAAWKPWLPCISAEVILGHAVGLGSSCPQWPQFDSTSFIHVPFIV